MTEYVGVDVHVETCHAIVMGEDGKVVKREKFRNERGA